MEQKPKLAKVKMYTVIFNEDNHYYVHKWDKIRGQYSEKPLNENGFKSEADAQRWIKSLNEGTSPSYMSLNIDSKKK